jgi:hypothetical protein
MAYQPREVADIASDVSKYREIEGRIQLLLEARENVQARRAAIRFLYTIEQIGTLIPRDVRKHLGINLVRDKAYAILVRDNKIN